MQLAKMEMVGWTEEMPNIHQKIETMLLHHILMSSRFPSNTPPVCYLLIRPCTFFIQFSGWLLFRALPSFDAMTDYIVSLSSVSSCKICEKLPTKPVAEIKCILFLSLDQLDHYCNSHNLIRCSIPLPIAYFIASTSSALHQADQGGSNLSFRLCPVYQKVTSEGEPADHRY